MREVATPADGALVLFSGGQDSTVCLAWALQRWGRVETVGFDYGQRHAVEMTARQAVRAGLLERFPDWAARLGPDHVLDLRGFGAVAQSALTEERAIEMTERGLPSTFVPGRNLAFFVNAAALADRRGLTRLVGGMCETDYSGYPDCRRDTLDAMERALNLGMEQGFVIDTPLMRLTKAQTWALAQRLGGAPLVELIREETHTCYLGDRAAVTTGATAAVPARPASCARGDTRNGSPRAGRPWTSRHDLQRPMTYSIKEIFLTLQGEGGQAGRAAVFCRFSGCNLWSGREQDRAGAVCTFCDTDFVGTDGQGGGRFAVAADLAGAVARAWGPATEGRMVVITGGEPLLQLDAPLVEALHGAGFRIAVETNGTLAAPEGIDWLCVSPKADAPLAQTSGQELKLAFPQPGVDPARFEGLDFEAFYLQPIDGPEREANTRAAIAYCLAHPRWRLSVQTHKYLGIP
jgi:7-carboxy-7-deazaguanine synthase (Cx14CxxC type)/queuosine biosynthesis protein QueC